jgi:hypothetical protein
VVYDTASVTTREYPNTLVPPSRRTSPEIKAPALIVEDAEVDVYWGEPEIERVHAEVTGNVPVSGSEASVRHATGSGPSVTDAIPAALPERKRSVIRPSLRGILGEDVENELDVPTFIRRHSASQ